MTRSAAELRHRIAALLVGVAASIVGLSTARFLTPKDAVIHEKGLTPDLVVEAPSVEFGAEPPATDVILEKALERVAPKAAAECALPTDAPAESARTSRATLT